MRCGDCLIYKIFQNNQHAIDCDDIVNDQDLILNLSKKKTKSNPLKLYKKLDTFTLFVNNQTRCLYGQLARPINFLSISGQIT
ncbi:hypothetical protein BpHYR1_044812 [Brachionus plicatilis]|uniref:Uncharacterized protein n=1 Tax=Brachionus plicatilis TaxID=10195 RepID=A0A3M7QH38_BRAPC|nr:hypothetical protein BpHYR1_044812 [Brachionus plicatilis]